MVRASLHAGFTANTLFSVDLSHTVNYADRVELAGVSTVAQTQTSVRTGPASTVEHLGSFTTADTIQLFDFLRYFSRTFTHNHGDFRFYIAACNAQDLTDLSCYSCTADRAESCSNVTVAAQSLCIIRTSCESTGTAVSAREHFFNGSNAFVHWNEHQLRCDGQDDTGDQTNCCYDYSR